MTSCLHVETDGGAYSPIRPCQRSTCDHCPVWAFRQYLETCFRFCHNGTQVIWINWFWICMSWISLGSLTPFFPTLSILKSQSVQHCTAVPTSWRDALVAADSIPFPKFAWSRKGYLEPWSLLEETRRHTLALCQTCIICTLGKWHWFTELGPTKFGCPNKEWESQA